MAIQKTLICVQENVVLIKIWIEILSMCYRGSKKRCSLKTTIGLTP